MTKAKNNSIKLKTAQISLIVGIALFFIKISAYFITSSSAIFSDAAESVVHILATGMVLYSILLSSRPADENHLYGHGNVEYFSAGIEGMLIIFAAFTIIYFAVSDMIMGAHPNQLNIGSLLIGSAGIINLLLGYWIIKKGKLTNSLALIADGKHILTDAFTSIGVVLGLILVILTDIYIFDPLVAIAVALNIIFTGYKLIRASIGGLMMETDDELLDKITELIKSIRKDHLIDIHQLRFWKSADFIFIDFHLTLPFFFNVKQTHNIEEEISEQLSSDINNFQIRTHYDFCEPDLCKYCKFQPCNERSDDFSELLIWDRAKLLDEPMKKQ